MKIDMHCHTREGSLDAKVDLKSYIEKLIDQGFDGMVVTDHNSYSGYRKWKDGGLYRQFQDRFTVFRGIEYDTRDGGHILAILPDHVHSRLLELRGLSLDSLERLVHGLGGVLGPAHPYGTGFFALMHNRWVKRHQEIIHKFDFIETFNSCTASIFNRKAELLARKYKKPSIAGSDGHELQVIGTAATIFDCVMHTNNDLIRAIRESAKIIPEKVVEGYGDQKKNPLLKGFCVVGYWVYNQAGALFYSLFRSLEMRRCRHLWERRRTG